MFGRRPLDSKCPAAFTLIELLVVIAVMALLISILLPALGKARQTAMNATCRTHIREQLLAAQLYATENEDYLPRGINYDWELSLFSQDELVLDSLEYIQDVMIPYVGGVRQAESSVEPILHFSEVFRCPSVEQNAKFDWLLGPEQNHYRYNIHHAVIHETGLGREVGSVRDPSRAVLTYDVMWPDWYVTDFPHEVNTRSINVGYVDGHVGGKTASQYFAESPAADLHGEGENPFVKLGWD